MKNDQFLYEKKVKDLKLTAMKSRTSLLSFWGTALSQSTKKKDNFSLCSSMQTQSDSSETKTMNETEVIKIGNTF